MAGKLDEIMTCSECGKLCGIFADGIACLDGHGKIHQFALIGEKDRGEIRHALCARFPQQVVKHGGHDLNLDNLLHTKRGAK